ncbi:MAG TPA: MBOAT family O-acyltransferase [Xanthobacteraceae bacterium]|nr:MBOAT family O-acyltransferase [Xanthobacteraceae bacterium]
MVFSSIIFLFYFLPLFFLAFIASGFSKNALLVFSLIFYAWGEPIFIPLLLVMICLNFWLGLRIEGASDPRAALRWVTLGIVANLAPLVIFKYGTFALQPLLNVTGGILVRTFGIAPENVRINHLPLPLGISFYTFHSLSYLIDIYRKDMRAERSLRDLAVYIAMFPQLVAGPIIRFKTIAHQIHKPVVSADRAAAGIKIFIVGLAQKVLIANTVAASADQIFALPPDQLSTPLSWIGIVCYTLQIYYDFGGYSNMAIGLALMIGFNFPINFNYPYIASSMTDFWRRWHISLSSWFRDYLYIPLGGNRVSPARTYFNLWVVFLLCGLWHGAAWNFVAWGAAHGAFLVFERIGFARVLERAGPVVRHGYVLLAVMATWALFRADTLGGAVHYLTAMAGFGADPAVAPSPHRFLGFDVLLAMGAGVLAAGPWGARWGRALADRLVAGPVRVGQLAGAAALLALVTLSLAGGAYNPFIYFRF